MRLKVRIRIGNISDDIEIVSRQNVSQ
uniref:Uncharacterized protein n=1 Tax=Arundo donax TaxID=35708 RepID=A0A0A9ACM6_ARUDO